MKKQFFLVFAAIFGFAASSASSQDLSDPRNKIVEGSSAEIQAWQEECRRTDNIEEGTCIVTVKYQSDIFPVLFIQNGVVLERVDSAEAGGTGFEAVQGVRYDPLPNGGMKYMLEIRNPLGATFIFKEIGS